MRDAKGIKYFRPAFDWFKLSRRIICRMKSKYKSNLAVPLINKEIIKPAITFLKIDTAVKWNYYN